MQTLEDTVKMTSTHKQSCKLTSAEKLIGGVYDITDIVLVSCYPFCLMTSTEVLYLSQLKVLKLEASL